MKKINYYLGALALASLSLGACSSDKLAGEEPNGPDTKTERTLYVNLAIHGDGTGSRAAGTDGNPAEPGDFDNGDPDTEGKVNSVYLVFYDKTGNAVGEIVSIENPQFTQETTVNGTIESRLARVVTVTLQQGQDDPEQVMCYINPANPADLKNPLSTVQTITRDAAVIEGTDGKLFPMSNSVYYGTDGNLKMAVDIPSESIFDTYEKADEALKTPNSTNIIDIYVERYATRLTMQGIATPTPYTTATTSDAALGAATEVPVVLSFQVEKWALNGEANTTFAVKSFREASTQGQILPNNLSYTALDAIINVNEGTWVWNAPGFRRSYWGCSPVYFQSEYPEVADDYTADPTKFNQTFLSYDDIVTGGKGFDPTANNTQYFKETTVGTPGLDSDNPNAAVASVIIVGHYTMTVGGTPVPNPSTFYTYVRGTNGNPTVYFDGTGDNAASTVAGGLSMQKRFLWQTTVLYRNNNGSYVRMSANNSDELSAMVRATTIARPSDKVLGDTKMASRARTLQFTGSGLNGIYINDNGTPKEIVDDTAEDFDEATVNEATQITLTRANYILWQNIINSWQLWKKRKNEIKT